MSGAFSVVNVVKRWPFFAIGLGCLLLGALGAKAAGSLDGLSLFSEQYPHAWFFRPEGSTASNPYDYWSANLLRLDGVMMKVAREEVATLTTNALPYLQQFAATTTGQVALVHWNGRSRDPLFYGNLFSAGHWIYHPGCGITNDVALLDTNLYVTNTSLFRTNIGLTTPGRNDDIVIVPMDGAGKKLWDQAEQARIVSIGTGVLTVDRAQYGTAARAFKAGQTYVAPHAWEGPWGNSSNPIWFYNFSPACPRDANGQTASDVFANQLTAWFAPGGPWENFHGIEFDVSYWYQGSINGRRIDIDADGVGDLGIINNTNLYGLGVHQFLSLLRTNLGEDRLIMADAGDENNQRSVGILNGMEVESFSGLNDPYIAEWSSALNRLLFWQTNVTRSHKAVYINHKITALTNNIPFNLHRIVLSAASCLGLACPYASKPDPEDLEMVGIWDELRQGTNRTPRWLGAPLGDFRRLATNTPDLLNGEGVSLSPAFVSRWASTNAAFLVTNGALRIAGTRPQQTNNIIVTFTNLNVPAGDLLLTFKIKADPMPQYPADVPRLLLARALNRRPYPGTADQLSGYAGTNECPVTFYFRQAGPTNVTLQLILESTNHVYLRDFAAYNATDALVREFEHGIVLCNPSSNNYTFDLAALFPGQTFRRLVGTPLQDTNVNNGALENGNLVVGPLDGLFLTKYAPAPDFAADLTITTNQTLTVHFSNLATNGYDTWAWDFQNDGVTDSTALNPAFTYNNYGAYTVTLAANGASGATNVVKTNFIILGKPQLVSRYPQEFSAVQGSNQWYYREWNGFTYAPLTWLPASNYWFGSHLWTRITSAYDHPDTYETVHSWLAPSNGWVVVSGQVAKNNTNNGDGVTASVRLNANLVWGPQDIAFNDNRGYAFNFALPVAAGDFLNFHLNMDGDHTSDATRWTNVIAFIAAANVSPANRAPIASNLTVTLEPGIFACHVNETQLLSHVWDADGDAIVLTNAFSSTPGAAAAFVPHSPDNYVAYSRPKGLTNDQFYYVVSDGKLNATGAVRVQVAPLGSRTVTARLATNQIILSDSGVAGFLYDLLWSTNLADWSFSGISTAAPNGALFYAEPATNRQKFFRLQSSLRNEQ